MDLYDWALLVFNPRLKLMIVDLVSTKRCLHLKNYQGNKILTTEQYLKANSKNNLLKYKYCSMGFSQNVNITNSQHVTISINRFIHSCHMGLLSKSQTAFLALFTARSIKLFTELQHKRKN